MKKDTHPTTYPTVFVDTSSRVEFVTVSTMKGETTREIDGVTYYVIPMEISSASHPFFTGKQVLVDTARRVEKFEERMKKTAGVAQTRKGKKVKRAKAVAKAEAKKADKKEKKVKKDAEEK